MRRHLAAAAAVGLLVFPSPVKAGDAPDLDAVDFAPVDLVTLELAAGVIGSVDMGDWSVDLRGAVTGVSARFLGMDARALRFEVSGRPGLHTTSLGATVVAVNAWMIGRGIADSSLCPFWLFVLCDEETGFLGFSISLVGVQHDTATTRTVLRVGELDVVASVTPGFGAQWSKFRFLPRVGVSLDRVWNAPGRPDEWNGRLAVGFDAAARIGPLDVQPTFRWRPSFQGIGDDYGFEVGLGLSLRRTWHGLDAAGDALVIGTELGYGYWSDPVLSYGSDWLLGGKHTVFARIVIAPSLFSAARP